MNAPIGVFDSGVGGLTVVNEIRRLMPAESIVYAGDSGRAPYGGKDAETLLNHGRELIRFLLSKNAKAIVTACGTSSSNSYERLCKEFPDIPIIDTLRPAVKATVELARQNPNIKPVFIATAATVKSGLFARLFGEAADRIKLRSVACPLFAPMAEAGLSVTDNHPLLLFAADNYLSELRGKADTVILGCTHYPLLTEAITHALGEVTYINPATATAEALKKIMTETENNKPVFEYYTSGDTEKFSNTARFILNEPVTASFCEFSRESAAVPIRVRRTL